MYREGRDREERNTHLYVKIDTKHRERVTVITLYQFFIIQGVESTEEISAPKRIDVQKYLRTQRLAER